MSFAKSALVAAGLMTASPVFAQDPIRPDHVVDLSYPLDEEFPWIEAPGTFPFSKSPIATIEQYGVGANAWTIHEHLGTQIDAPRHFALGGRSVHELSPGELFAPIVVIDFKKQAETDVDAEITIDVLKVWESENGRIPEGAIVIMNSGWGERVSDPDAFVNLDAEGVKRFPGFHRDAAAWLMDERGAWGVGVDTISFDPGYDGEYRSHKALEERDGWAIEALANLDHLPSTGATLFVGAANVRGATGGPVRPVAVWNGDPVGSTSLRGSWESAKAEPIPDGNGGFRYLTRKFEFGRRDWSIDFTMHADEERTRLLYAGRNEGRYKVDDSTSANGSFPAYFGFETRSLTPGTREIADALTSAGCGSGPWRIGEAQNVIANGCSAFRVFSKDECDGEFDRIQVRGDQLYLGARPADGFMCTSRSRPKSVGSSAVVRTTR